MLFIYTTFVVFRLVAWTAILAMLAACADEVGRQLPHEFSPVRCGPVEHRQDVCQITLAQCGDPRTRTPPYPKSVYEAWILPDEVICRYYALGAGPDAVPTLATASKFAVPDCSKKTFASSSTA